MTMEGVEEGAQEQDLSEKDKGILEQSRGQNEDLLQSNEALKSELAKIKELNDQIREKEKVLQLELTKARAQSVGLEKICEDFKEQIEIMSEAGNEG